MSYSSSSSTACSPPSSPYSNSGVFEICKCGRDLKLEKVMYGSDIGRLLYRCSRREESGEHTEKTFDKAVGDKLLSHWASIVEHEQKLKKLSHRLKDFATTVDPEKFSRDLFILQEQMSAVMDELACKSDKAKPRLLQFKIGGLYTWMWACFAVSIMTNSYLMWT